LLLQNLGYAQNPLNERNGLFSTTYDRVENVNRRALTLEVIKTDAFAQTLPRIIRSEIKVLLDSRGKTRRNFKENALCEASRASFWR
jgi:hypothetical protein